MYTSWVTEAASTFSIPSAASSAIFSGRRAMTTSGVSPGAAPATRSLAPRQSTVASAPSV